MAANRTAGGIYGEAQPGATIVVTNEDTGLTRQASANDDGRFSFVSLPTGRYTVQQMVNGNVTATRTIGVQIATSSHVSFVNAAQQLGTIEVVGGAVNPIDVTTSGASLVLTDTQVEQLPVPRDVNAVALLAPHTSIGDPGYGNLVSFGGASQGENAYFLNGLNITDIRNFLSYAQPPFEAISQFQIKAGGFDASFGGALGGVVNVVTKSGTNTFHAGANIFWAPPGLHANSPNVIFRSDDGTFAYQLRNAEDTYFLSTPDTRINVYGSGPIVEDHLFFYALYQRRENSGQDVTSNQYQYNDESAPYGLLKLDWQINSENLLEFTAMSTEREREREFWHLAQPESRSTWHPGEPFATETRHRGSRAFIGKYTWTPTQDFSISALWGYVTFDHNTDSSSAMECPYSIDYTTGAPHGVGCYTTWNAQGANSDDHDARHQTRIDGQWQIGSHDITFGVDYQKFFTESFSTYSGGNRYNYHEVPQKGDFAGTVNGVDAGPYDYYVGYRYIENGGTFTTKRQTWYLQDNWKIGDFYFRYGLRSTSYTNLNAIGGTFLDINNKLQPRLGLSWDVFGDSSFKLYANAGRYYIPVASNTNVRLASSEFDYTIYYGLTPGPNGNLFDEQGKPINLGEQLGPKQVTSNGGIPPADTVVVKNLEPMYSDEYILGGTYRVGRTQWSVGLQLLHSELKAAMDDFCEFAGTIDWLARQYPKKADKAFMSENFPTCLLLNPGNDAKITTKLNADADPETFTVPADVIGLPKATRYHNAVSVLFNRAFDGTWFLKGSLTWSHTYGTEPGYLLPVINQADAGLTQSFDHTWTQVGGYGNLPTDHRWTFKTYVAYQFAPEWRFGVNTYIQSGRPISCYGYYPDNSVPGWANYGAFSHYCGGELVTRGSVGRTDRLVRLDLSLHYMPDWAPGLRFGMSVFNAFNFQSALTVNEVAETSAGVIGPTYLLPNAYQTPRYFRFSVEYDFL
ncbi:MAG TPA: carboxypeptidase regulatory-like domain-containing protein [Gammaproteobacteria bacterium]|nr:carboxypeptidase regulatory-like domain-containing protein [Gammaproteobacteria bacterium]